ncbi:MaoC/PaaZ C-terminal domain-containing protein [Geodermatophilus sp. SYSU D00815]
MSGPLRTVPAADVPARYAAVSGDDSPLHLDEAAAREAGLDGVILHGMYLFGLAVRAASTEVDEDPRRVRAARAQFRAPGVPGVELVVDVAAVPDEPGVRAVTVRQGGADLLREGRVTVAG